MQPWMYLFALLLIPTCQSELNLCLTELIEVVTKLTTVVPTTPYEEMAAYSGKGLNDLGDYFSCCNLKGAKYALFSVFVGTSNAYLAVCGPGSCTREDYYEIISNLTEATPPSISLFSANINSLHQLSIDPTQSISIVFPQTYIHDNFTNLSAGAIVMLIVCIVLGLVAALGTAIDIQKHHPSFAKSVPPAQDEYQLISKPEAKTVISESESAASASPPFVIDLLQCFSLYSNLPKLFSSRAAEKVGQSRDPLEVLNAVRVMSMGWVILGHVYIYRFVLGALKNPLAIDGYMKSSKTAIIYAGLYSVDSFFWLSGFLMAFLLLQQLNSKRSLSAFGWLYLYGHRFYRILPAYMFVLFLTWAFTKYIGNGPLWYMGDAVNLDCKRYWWTNMIFLNNFLPDGNVSGCLGQTWYLANDMQFFLISPPIFYLYHNVHRLLGWVFVSSLCICAILSGFILSYENHYSVVFLNPVNTVNKFMPDYYVKPYCRVGPYAVGIACGMVLYSYRNYKKTGQIYDKFALRVANLIEIRLIRYCFYAVGLFFINFFIFIQYTAYKDIDNGWTNWNRDENSVFIAFSRTCWAIGMSLVLMPMMLGYNKIAIWFMSLSLWSPLARLTFCTYLIHLHFVYIIYLSQKEAYWFSDLNIVITLTFIAVISYAAAVPLTLLVESPFMAFEKMMKIRATIGKRSIDK